jgi:hypothetical protein
VNTAEPAGELTLEPRAEEATRLMLRFAERTGLTSDRPQQRYLWTDAFAVCNFLGMARATGERSYGDLALRLVDRVHATLGRHRGDDSRTGWISGLGELAGAAHPTRGGLRIGKKLPERLPEEPFDEQLEWDRDGQYLHYLTKWMHALDQVARWTGERRFNLWARELAAAVFAGFSFRPREGGRLRLVWKMSVDLSRALVPSMGQHDSLDGFITCAQLRATASALPGGDAGPNLREEIAGFASMVEARHWATADPLGQGGLLMDAARVAQIRDTDGAMNEELLDGLLAAARDSLRYASMQDELEELASMRLAFRELGLAIGLHALEVLEREHAEPGRPGHTAHTRALLASLEPHRQLGRAIESFWLNPEHRRAASWTTHQDINEVMLATSLLPDGCLRLAPVQAASSH